MDKPQGTLLLFIYFTTLLYFLAKLGVGSISVDIYVRRYKGELSFSGEAHQLRPSLLHPLLLLLY